MGAQLAAAWQLAVVACFGCFFLLTCAACLVAVLEVGKKKKEK